MYKPWRSNVFCQFEVIINVLVVSFRFILIPMSWVYGDTYFTLSVLGSTLDVRISRQVCPRVERVYMHTVSYGRQDGLISAQVTKSGPRLKARA